MTNNMKMMPRTMNMNMNMMRRPYFPPLSSAQQQYCRPGLRSETPQTQPILGCMFPGPVLDRGNPLFFVATELMSLSAGHLVENLGEYIPSSRP